MKDWDNMVQLTTDKKNGGGAAAVLAMMKEHTAPKPALAR